MGFILETNVTIVVNYTLKRTWALEAYVSDSQFWLHHVLPVARHVRGNDYHHERS